LQNALTNLREETPLLMADWDECLKRIAMSAPESLRLNLICLLAGFVVE